MKIYKICEYCHGINRIGSERCTKCGRFKDNLILGEYSPTVDDQLTEEMVKLAQENFLPKSKYPYYKENIVPTRETYPVSTRPKDNLLLNVWETSQPPMPHVSPYDDQIQRQQALAKFYLMTNPRPAPEPTLIDVIMQVLQWLFEKLQTKALFRYIFGILIAMVFLIWFLGGLFAQLY